MLKVLRLNSDAFRNWRQNVLYLVDDAGKVVRPATPNETHEWNQHRSRGLELKLALDDGREVGFRTSRQIMKEQLLAEHGDVQVRAPNGRIIATVRDPEKRRVSLAESQQVAPSPERCDCAQWGEKHPGRHHAVCQWNRYAPEAQRGDVPAATQVVGQPVVMKLSEVAGPQGPETVTKPPALGRQPSAVAFAAPIPSVALPSVPDPRHCTCSSWLSPDGTRPEARSGHHPICQHFEPWQRLHPTAPEPAPLPPPTVVLTEALTEVSKPEEEVSVPLVLVDLDTRQVLRDATPEEVEESTSNIESDGTPTVVLDGKTYLVVHPTALPTAG